MDVRLNYTAEEIDQLLGKAETSEQTSSKAQSIATGSATQYTSVNAVRGAIDTNWNNPTDTKYPSSLLVKNSLNEKADLVGGKVPASQLPSYVDDVVGFEKVLFVDYIDTVLPLVTEVGKFAIKADDILPVIYKSVQDGSEIIWESQVSLSPDNTDIFISKKSNYNELYCWYSDMSWYPFSTLPSTQHSFFIEYLIKSLASAFYTQCKCYEFNAETGSFVQNGEAEEGKIYVSKSTNNSYRRVENTSTLALIATTDVATQTKNGLMSSTDKVKLDGLSNSDNSLYEVMSIKIEELNRHVESAEVPTNEIWYTTVDGQTISTPTNLNAGVSTNTYANGKGVLKLNGTLTGLGSSCFFGKTTLKTITLPGSLTNVINNVFENCTELKHIYFPDAVTQIGDNVLGNCSNLLSAVIGKSVGSIGNEAFVSCSNCEYIIVKATTPPTLGSQAFDATGQCPIYVPSGSVNTYKAAAGWSTYATRIKPF